MAKNPNKLSKDERLQVVVRMLREAQARGLELETREVMERCSVSRPTAIATIQAAAKLVGVDNAERSMAQGIPGTEVAIAPAAPQPGLQLVQGGIDMVGILSTNAGRLERIAVQMQFDLAQMRTWLMVRDQGGLPEMCVSCNEAHNVGIRDYSEDGPDVSFSDLASMYRSFIAAQKELTGVVDSYNGVLAQVYNYQALEGFMRDVYDAIRDVCPEHMRAIATRIKEKGGRVPQ